MKYLLSTEQYNWFSNLNVNKIMIGRNETKYGILFNKYSFDKFVENNHRIISTILSSKLGITVDEWLNSKVVYGYKIYKYIPKNLDTYVPPLNIDFTTGLTTKLFKKKLPLVHGIPTSVEYYANKTQTGVNEIGDPIYEYSDLVVKIDFDIKYSDIGFMTERTQTITWYYENGEPSPITKVMRETFSMADDFDKITDEGILRRGNIIKELQYPLLAMLKVIYADKTLEEILIIGRSFLDEQDAIFKGFIERALTVTDTNSSDFGKKVAYVEIRDYNGTHSEWLDYSVEGVTPRQYIMQELDI